MLLSIIIPIKNRAHIISDTLDSLNSDKFEDTEIILVDNNSNDNLSNILKNYKNVKYIKNDIDRERSYSRNIGIKNANGDYLTFLDSDDLLDSDFLSYLKKAINKFSQDNFFFINFNYFNTERVIKNKNLFNKKFCKFSDLVNENKISNIGIVLKKKLAQEILWDENNDIIGTEDYDYVLRLMIKAKRAVLIDKKPLGNVRIHDGRSVYQDKRTKILKRFFYFKKKLYNLEIFKNIDYKNKKKIISTQAIYSSLLLLNCGEKKKSKIFLLYTIKINFFALFSKRFLYLVYQLILKK